ncbi:MAG TPA: NUDIX hydrolase [Hyphomicrobiales bacterium]|nr:NUDIX hydrolase [Hyphomicrobiales bacterium]
METPAIAPSLNPSGEPPVVETVGGFDARLDGGAWPYLDENTAAITAHWAAAVAEKPALFDGRVLVARRLAVNGGRVETGYTEIPFSALLYWRHCAFPPAGALNCFGAAVVRSRDGAILLGRMADHTANAGRIYFPAGTPDRDDVVGDRVDLDGSILRELAEETGLAPPLLWPTDRRWLVRDDPLACCARLIEVDCDAAEVERQVRMHLAAETQPELADAHLIRRRAEIDRDRVPAYAQALLDRLLPA